MAVVFSDESPKEIGGRTGTQHADWKRTYTRQWRVITDDPFDGPRVAREGIPVGLGMHYEVSATERDTGAFANEITAAEESSADDFRSWIVTVQYGPYQPLLDPQNPLDKDPTFTWSGTPDQRIADRDVDNEPIVNTANDPYDPPVMMDISRPVLELTRNEASYDESYASAYRDKVNSSTFWGADPGTVKVASIVARYVKHPDLGHYYEVTYTFHFRPETWHVFVLEQGFNSIVYDPGIIGDTGKKVKIKDDKGSEVSAPWPLDDIGQRMAAGDTPIFTEWIIYGELDFSVFGFDDFYASLTGP